MSDVKKVSRVSLNLDLESGDVFAEWHDQDDDVWFVAILANAAFNTPLFDVCASKSEITFASLPPQGFRKDKGIKVRIGDNIPNAVKLLKQSL